MMTHVHAFVKHIGRWVKPSCYLTRRSEAILIHTKATYDEFLDLLYVTLQISPSTHKLHVKYEIEGSVPPGIIASDLS